MSNTLFEYYSRHDVLPTHGGFQSIDDLNEHEIHRRRLFTDKLFLPPRLFNRSRLLEFGPDAGENSLVFALWGAACTLAEPNQKAHSVIGEYFERFGLGHQLAALTSEDVATYREPGSEEEGFDVIDAEGFIYTIKPESIWIEKFSRLVRKDGFVILFYCETCGSFVELMLKVIQARFRQITGLDDREAATRLFQAKWDSIPHKRKIESWVMDVLENPFVRLRYFLDPSDLCRQMYRAGFQLYSSWPPYRDGTDVHWFKKVIPATEQLRIQDDFIARSRLSHLFGRRHFLVCRDAEMEKTVSNLLRTADDLIDNWDPVKARACNRDLSRLATTLRSDAIVTDEADRRESLETVDSFGRLLHFLEADTPENLVEYCNRDRAFSRSWGMPSHFAVFRKEGN